jgi:ribosomal protein L37E
MWNERLYFCLALAAAGLLFLTAAVGLALLVPDALAPAADRLPGPPVNAAPSTLAEGAVGSGAGAPARTGSVLFVWSAAILGLGLLGSAFVLILRGSRAPGSAGPRSARRCARCRQPLDPATATPCPHCGAATRCPRCGTDLTRGGADVCQSCGAPWGCRYCGYSLKGLASSPCPVCNAHVLCHRCGASVHHNITGRCAACGARIAGWREWR